MSYIIKSTSPFVSIKLTEKGREMLSLGKLNFTNWAIGDSEINYNRETIVDSNSSDVTLSATSAILRPLDRQPDIKTFITPNGSLNPFQEVNGSVLNVVKAIVNNKTIDRGFFTFNGTKFETKLTSDLVLMSFTGDTLQMNGTNTLQIPTTNLKVGDLVLIKPMFKELNGNDEAYPRLWYKIMGLTPSDVTLDRKLPSLVGGDDLIVLIYRGGEVYESIASGNTSAYWDSGTLSFSSNQNITCHDVPVWNMNSVWCEDIAGLDNPLYEDYTKFGSYKYLGAKNPFMEYVCQSNETQGIPSICDGVGLSYLDEVSKSISIIHFTNNSISNLYGEFFYTDTASGKYLSLHMPELMYHRVKSGSTLGTSMGMRFIATGSTKVIPNTDIEYIELVEDPSMVVTSKVVGRIYPQMKTCVIHDDEIVMANSYKSNRNWTLPELSATLVAPALGATNGVLNMGETLYMTYTLKNTSGLGYATGIHCQKYIKITNDTSTTKDIAFRINEIDQFPYMRKFETTDGLGFTANEFALVYQVVQNASERPDPAAWREVDFTSPLITNVAGESINPLLLEGQNYLSTGFLFDKARNLTSIGYSIISTLELPANTQPEYLQFGDEKFFYGNLTTHIGATIYKTIFDIRVNASLFNTTTNPTRSKDMTTNPPNIKISEVGVYDSDKNLVCIGKLSNPVPLAGNNTIMIELSMDF